MQCVINEKIKMPKIVQFLVTIATKVGGVTMYKNAYFYGFLNYYSHFSSLHRDIYS